MYRSGDYTAPVEQYEQLIPLAHRVGEIAVLHAIAQRAEQGVNLAVKGGGVGDRNAAAYVAVLENAYLTVDLDNTPAGVFSAAFAVYIDQLPAGGDMLAVDGAVAQSARTRGVKHRFRAHNIGFGILSSPLGGDFGEHCLDLACDQGGESADYKQYHKQRNRRREHISRDIF